MAGQLMDRIKGVSPLFIACVLVPTLLAVLYFGLIAPDVYISESRFVIRSPEKQTSSALGALLKAPGVSVSGDEVFAVQEFVESRDAFRALDHDGFAGRVIADRHVGWLPHLIDFGWDDSFEAKYRYFRKRVDVTNESTSSISVMKLRAYNPETAFELNKRLLGLGEALVNRLNNRSREDLIGYAKSEVETSRSQAQQASLALAAFRNRSHVVDPERQATIQLQMVSKLEEDLISTKSQLVQMRTLAPGNPQVPVLQARARDLSQDIQQEIAKAAGGDNSLAGSAVEYQRLFLESQFADKQLGAAMASLESAREEATRKQVYLERVVEPNKPDEPEEPKRLRDIFSTFVLGLVAWGVLSMLLAGLREHRD